MNPSIAHLSPEQKRQLLAKLVQQKQQARRFPLSFAQQRFWFLDQLQPGSAAYNLPAAFRLEGAIDSSCLAASLQLLIQRHEGLRTSFGVHKANNEHTNKNANQAIAPGDPYQQIHPAASIALPLTIVDLRALPTALQHRLMDFLMAQDCAQPFDLSRPPLLRATLLHLSETVAILLVTLHHIVADYWSLRILIRELTQIYQALRLGQAPALPDLPIQYADYAVWQRQWLNQTEHATQLAYWCDQLRDQTPLQLPTDFPHPKTPSGRGAKHAFQLTPEQTAALNQLSRQSNTTLFITLLAAFQILLHRYSGQSDISVGSTVTNRDRPELSHLVGLFVNNLVLRTQIQPHLSVHQLLQQVREVTLAAYTHQTLPYEYLVEHLQPDRQLNINPLFQVSFVLHNTPQQSVVELPDLKLHYLDPASPTARFDLSLDMAETPAGLVGVFEYSRDLFQPETIARLAGHFATLIDGILANPNQRIAELPLLSAGEMEQQGRWNATKMDLPPLCLPHLFEAQVDRTPDAIAAYHDTTALSYQTLNAQANQLAHRLLALSLPPETPIALCLDRSLDLLVALLAILKAGACYLPLDPALPPARLAFLLNNAQAPVLLTTTALVNWLPPVPHTLLLDTNAPLPPQPTHNPTLALSPQHAAYLLYTSGSTGTPKAVQILHSALTNFLLAMQQQVQMSPEDTLLAVTTLSFDIAALELFLPLITGAAVVIAPQTTTLDASQLALDLERHHVTLMQATPATWRLLLHAGWSGKADLTLLCGGEALDRALATQLLQSGKALWNLYGPTETTIWSTAYRVVAVPEQTVVPIGRPLTNQQCYVLDAQLQPLPVGVAGELYIGGAGLARGYYQQPQLTAERFVPAPNSRLYKTGDRVRYRPDGVLEYLGRLDQQVKVRGYRIELGEIESVLQQHPAVRAAVVVPRQTGAAVQLVAYVVAAASEGGLEEVRALLRSQLPSYMLPAAIVRLEELPLTPNGKLDRSALPPPDLSPAPRRPPRTPIEELLVHIWQDTLGLATVNIDDNFFELGGHSLLATRVIAQIRDTFDLELPLRHLFEQPTIAALAEVISTTQSGWSLPPIQPAEQPTLSFAQQRLWFLAQLEPDSPFYTIPAAIQISGALNITLLQRCFAAIGQRHQVLRTAFLTVEGQPALTIHDTIAITLPLIDLSVLPAAIQTQQLQDLAAAEAILPFAIDRAPLLRLKLLRLQPDEHVLLLTLHHIVADGSSIDLLLREVATLYAACQREPSAALPAELLNLPDLPDLPVQFADFAAWQRSWLQGEVLAQQLTYWRQQLQDLPDLLDLPTDHPRPAQPSSRGSSVSFSIAPDTKQALQRLSQQCGCTLFMTLLAAFQLLLHRYTDSDDIVVGTPIANRRHSATEFLIGCFANTLVLRTDLSGNPRFCDLLQRVKQVALGAYSHQDLPFEQLVDALQPQRSLSYSPLFQVMFSFQSASPQSLSIAGLTWSAMPRPRQTAKFDLTLAVTETEQELVHVLEYSLDLFEPATIERMAGHLQTLLEAIVQQPNCRISDLPLLTAAEQQQFSDWNQANHALEQCFEPTLIHCLFEAQVNRTPDAIALINYEQHLSYYELNARANQLAHHLIQLGVQPDTPIGLCLDRSVEMIVSLLAILKAGAAYLPIDPAYPADRQAFMLQDSQTQFLITRSPLPTPQTLQIIDLATWNPTPYPTHNPDVWLSPAHLAYLIYTSGSTGTPKAVAIEHRNSTALLHWSLAHFPHPTFAATLATTSLCFDLSVFEVFAPLASGGTVVVADSPLALPHLPQTHHLTFLNTVPSAAAHLLQLMPLPPSMHTVALAGEALPAALVQQLYQQPGVQHVYNLYGPSEDTTYSTWALVTPEQRLPPIGRPIAHTQAHLLDRYGNPVPIGVVGELYLSGAGLARGYYRRPELTAERFVPAPGSRLYRTGDRCRYLPTGELHYLGRLDTQVKLRGFRIELAEIEACLNQHPAIQQAIAHLWTDPTGHPRLVAYLLPHPAAEQPLHSSSLRAFLQSRLPDYMLPAAFVCLDRVPLTPNGKIDRRALPAPDFAAPPSDELKQADLPRTPVEAILVTIWQRVLGVESIGIHDNFFERGGDSILAIQVIAQASQAGLHLLPKHLFQAQTIAELAQWVDQAEPIQAEQGLVTGEVPLTPIQHWFFEQHLQEPQHWNQAVLLEVGHLNPIDLEQALRQLFHHHDALRLRFHCADESDPVGWQQVNVPPELTLPFTMIDLSEVEPERQSTAIETIAAELQGSLDLKTTPVRIALFRCGETRPDRLLWICHHLLIDGVSWRIVLTDLQTLYQQFQQGQIATLPPKTTSFQQWAIRLQTAAQSSVWQSALDYWQAIQPSSPLPQDFPQGSNTVADLEIVSVALNTTETEALLQTVPTAYQTQINDALLTALLLAFADWTGNRTLLLELEGHGREADLSELGPQGPLDLSRTIGWFTTLFPVWLNLESNQIGAALKGIKEQLRAIPQRGFSYGVLRYLANAPLPRLQAQVRFNYLGQIDQALHPPFAIAPEAIGPTRSPSGQRHVLLEINALIASGELRVHWGYSRAIHRPTTIATLAEGFIGHLRNLIQHCQSTDAGGYTPSDFPLMDISQTELDELLTEL